MSRSTKDFCIPGGFLYPDGGNLIRPVRCARGAAGAGAAGRPVLVQELLRHRRLRACAGRSHLEEGASTARRWPTFRSSVAPMASRRIADIVAAFLYIQTAEKIQGSGIDRAQFGATPGQPFFQRLRSLLAAGSNVPGSGTIAKALNWETGDSPCWSVPLPGGGRRLVTYRTDVFRFLPIDKEKPASRR